jgi:hypothetical protein
MNHLHRSSDRLAATLFLAALFSLASGTTSAAASHGARALVGANPTAPSLGMARSYVVLGASAVTSTGGTAIKGDLGVSSPGISPTGLAPGAVTGTTHSGDASSAQAQGRLTPAYNFLAAKTCATPLTGEDLGGRTLTQGVYCFTSSAQLTGRLTLNGDANSVFIFKVASTLNTASNSSVVMTGGSQARNVYWQVGSSASLGTDTAFKGNILALTSVSMATGASLSGRALARNGAVTLDGNAISMP